MALTWSEKARGQGWGLLGTGEPEGGGLQLLSALCPLHPGEHPEKVTRPPLAPRGSGRALGSGVRQADLAVPPPHPTMTDRGPRRARGVCRRGFLWLTFMTVGERVRNTTASSSQAYVNGDTRNAHRTLSTRAAGGAEAQHTRSTAVPVNPKSGWSHPILEFSLQASFMPKCKNSTESSRLLRWAPRPRHLKFGKRTLGVPTVVQQ